MNTHQPAIDVADLTHRYGSRVALDSLTLQVRVGEVFAMLGPNGGGKTTLFRVLSTLMPIQHGRVSVLGHDLPRETRHLRHRIGVVFQAPSLDRKLTVAENLRFQAALYGIRGATFTERRQELLEQLGLMDRLHDRIEGLSGGLRRRVELAKGMIHGPELLLLDEPSTGLDPGARSDLWEYLQRLRSDHGVTVVLTTHLLDEAERADRIAILDRGHLVALDTSEALKASLGGDTITICSPAPRELQQAIADRFDIQAKLIDGQLRIEQRDSLRWIGRLMEGFADQIDTITLGHPSLEDVFIDKTGHRFWSEAGDDESV